MKLKNICWSWLAIALLASCSDHDGPAPEPVPDPNVPLEASVSFAATSSLQTKAGETDVNLMNAKEKFVNTLTAYIFKDTGGSDESKTLLGQGTTVSEGGVSVDAVKHIVIKVSPGQTFEAASDDRFIAVLVANAETTASPANLKELKEMVLTKPVETYIPGDSYLPMASGEIAFTGVVPIVIHADGSRTFRENWIDDSGSVKVSAESTSDSGVAPEGLGKIELIRLVARVQVEELIMRIKGEYPEATFTLTHLAMVNVRPTASWVTGVGEYVKGYQSENYEPADKWIFPDAVVKSSLAKTYQVPVEGDQTVTFGASGQPGKFYCYVFPNASGAPYQTALLIAGKLKRHANAQEEVKHFRVILQDSKDGAQAVQVKKNHVYKLGVTVIGEGSGNEDQVETSAYVSVSLTVGEWTVITQVEDDTNE